MKNFNVTISKKFGDGTTLDRSKRIEASSAKEAGQKVYLAEGEYVSGIAVVPERDPYAFDMSLFRKEFRENVTALNEDAIADYHAKIERGEIILDPAPASEPKPIEASIDIDGRNEVGTIIEVDGVQRLCTWSGYISAADAAEAEDGHDVFIAPGWHSTLMHLDASVMTVLSEQYMDGAAAFPAHDRVKFADEQDSVLLSDLKYSSELGLYNASKVKL